MQALAASVSSILIIHMRHSAKCNACDAARVEYTVLLLSGENFTIADLREDAGEMFCLPHVPRPVLAVRPRAAAVYHGHDLVRPTIVAEDVGHGVLHLRQKCSTELSTACNAARVEWKPVPLHLAAGRLLRVSSVQIR